MASLVPEELLRSVVAYYDPRRVILFGSHARGEAGPDSDYDLCVIVDDDCPPERLSWRGQYQARRDFHQAVDLLLCRASVFEEKRRLRTSLANAVASEGIVVYERH